MRTGVCSTVCFLQTNQDNITHSFFTHLKNKSREKNDGCIILKMLKFHNKINFMILNGVAVVPGFTCWGEANHFCVESKMSGKLMSSGITQKTTG